MGQTHTALYFVLVLCVIFKCKSIRGSETSPTDAVSATTTTNMADRNSDATTKHAGAEQAIKPADCHSGPHENQERILYHPQVIIKPLTSSTACSDCSVAQGLMSGEIARLEKNFNKSREDTEHKLEQLHTAVSSQNIASLEIVRFQEETRHQLMQLSIAVSDMAGSLKNLLDTTIPVQVIVIDKGAGGLPLGEVRVKALVDHKDGQTEIVAEATTDLNGLANLDVPPVVSVKVVASKDQFVDTVRTYTVRQEGGNIIDIPMERFEEFTAFLYRQATFKNFEFGNIDEVESTFWLSFPEAALRARDRTTVNVYYWGVNVRSPDALSTVPDLTQVAGEPGQHLIPLRAAELSILDTEGRKLALRKPASMRFFLKDSMQLVGVRESIDAYYFNTDTGKWVKDGSGSISQTDDGPTWTYDTQHFTWWIVAILYRPIKCLTVRTCYDSACTQPASRIPIIIYGENFAMYGEYETGISGSICTDIFTGEMSQVHVLQNCTGESQLVTADVSSSSLCSDGSCQVVTFIIPDTVSSMCPNPGKPDNGVRIGDDFSLGAKVSFYCDPRFRIKGNSRRLCKQCGKWSGFQPFCTPVTDTSQSSYGSGDSMLDV